MINANTLAVTVVGRTGSLEVFNRDSSRTKWINHLAKGEPVINDQEFEKVIACYRAYDCMIIPIIQDRVYIPSGTLLITCAYAYSTNFLSSTIEGPVYRKTEFGGWIREGQNGYPSGTIEYESAHMEKFIAQEKARGWQFIFFNEKGDQIIS